MKKTAIILSLALGAMSQSALSIETTTPQKISGIQVLNDGGFYITPSTGTWGASDAACASAIYVYVTPGASPEWKSMLATAMTSKAADINIQFWGECNTDSNYFDASQIILK